MSPQHVDIDIEAQPLGQAITKLATQTDVLIGVDASLIADKQSPALSGRYTPAQAILQLLNGSGLMAVETTPGRYTVKSANHETSSSNEPIKLPEVKVTGFVDSEHRVTRAIRAPMRQPRPDPICR
ncbi:STN domain-containing protein [Nitrosomonas aestuarii]|uniref:STN domain-containing protein n=1 Tax=Nitrosomonas aestuarii TaxID=52441 RepID=UPI000B803C86|nr:STN domain-containing protein [Nitrosomonas aestuarii]